LQADVLQELKAAQAAAKDGVLHWDVQQFNKYAIGKKRPYTLIFFFTAKHLLNKPNLGLKKLRTEFGYLSKALVQKFGSTGKVRGLP
jgi:oligosaccharyltransferase complex subunit gamma